MFISKVRKLIISDLVGASLKVFTIKILSSLIGLLSGVYIARNYDVEMLGTVSFLSSIIGIVSVFGSGGLNTAIIKIIPQNKTRIPSVYYKSTVVSVVICFILALLLCSVSIFFYEIDNLYILIVTIFFMSYIKICMSLFRALNSVNLFLLFSILSPMLKLMLLYFLSSFTDIKNIPVLLVLLVPFFVGFILICYFKVRFNSGESTGEFYLNRDVVKLSYPFMMSELLYLIIATIDILVIGYFMSEYDVGIYSVALSFIAVLNMVYISIQSFVTPKFSNEYDENNKNKLSELVLFSTKLNVMSHLLPSICLIALGEYFLVAVYGGSYINSYEPLYVLTISILIKSMFGLGGPFLNMSGNGELYMKISFSVAVLNIILCCFLVPIYGIIGAAYSTGISLVIWGAIPALVVQYKFKYKIIYIPVLSEIYLRFRGGAPSLS